MSGWAGPTSESERRVVEQRREDERKKIEIAEYVWYANTLAKRRGDPPPFPGQIGDTTTPSKGY